MPGDLIFLKDAKDYARHAMAKGLNVLEYLDEVPAADVRPVVCCKDCVYAYPYGLEIKCTKHSGKADRLGEDATYSEFHSGNWFCADAQRKREKHGKV